MRKESLGMPLRRRIVDTILGGVDAFVQNLPMFPHIAPKGYIECEISSKEWEKIMDDVKNRRAIRDMRRKKYIDDKEEGRRVRIRISTDMLINTIKSSVKTTRKQLQPGHVCLVLFDFPNGATKARNMWRRLLLHCGFKKNQLSCYTCKNDVGEQIVNLVKLLQIEKWVTVFQGELLDP